MANFGAIMAGGALPYLGLCFGFFRQLCDEIRKDRSARFCRRHSGSHRRFLWGAAVVIVLLERNRDCGPHAQPSQLAAKPCLSMVEDQLGGCRVAGKVYYLTGEGYRQ